MIYFVVVFAAELAEVVKLHVRRAAVATPAAKFVQSLQICCAYIFVKAVSYDGIRDTCCNNHKRFSLWK